MNSVLAKQQIFRKWKHVASHPSRRMHNGFCSRLSAIDSSSLDSGVITIIGSGAAMLSLGLAYAASDPQKRREFQIQQTGGTEKDSVRDYFNGEGFDRWNKIYGTTEDVNKVQKDIREGHSITIEKTLNWLLQNGSLSGKTICDAGCGTGSLAIPLAIEGAIVKASDISEAMVKEAQQRYQDLTDPESKGAEFTTSDLESLTGEYDIVTCLDVMIHYPQDKADEMITHLASLAKDRLIISFAPKTLFYSILKRVGELFPGPSKATRAYLHSEEDVEQSLIKAGFKIVNREMTATNFYFSRLFEAVRQ
eukprot:g6974.t1